MTAQRPLTRAELERAVIEAEAIVAELDRRAAEKSLYEYVKIMWPVVEPATPFLDSWVIGAQCEHLQAITDGHIKNLLINEPPGCAKSLISNVFWPSWEWGPRNRPHERYVTASYSQGLTVRDNRKFREVITAPSYVRKWGDRFDLDSDNIELVLNKRTGWKLATSVGGRGTGERGSRVIIDDPNSVKEAESDTIRAETNRWFREVVPSRLNDLSRDPIVVIQQRTHENDVSGVILEAGMDFEHLLIPMEYDGRRFYTSIGWTDPRENDGDLAWPERFPPKVIADLKRDLGSHAYAGQYQQVAAPRGGGIIKRDWWKLWGNPDDPKDKRFATFEPMSYIVVSVDTALTTKEESDYTACTVWGIWRDEGQARVSWNGIDVDGFPQPKAMLMYAWRERLTLNALVNKVAFTAKQFRADRVLIEDKAAGHSAAQELARLHSGNNWGVTLFNPSRLGDKSARLYAVSHLFETGLIYAPDEVWADMVIDEISSFPRGAHDDLADTASQALHHLRATGHLVRSDERDAEVDEAARDQRPAMPLYPA
jgi:predicted phage terminase large subunit-like protein